MRTKYILYSLLIATLAFAEEAAQGQYDQVAQEIEKKILAADKVQLDRLKVLHEGSTIYLEGVAKRFGSRFRAGEIAGKYEGITKVDNQIALQITSVSDKDLELDLIRDIQGLLRSEPFDLVSVKVNHGSVELSGYVRDYPLKERVLERVIWMQGVRDVQDKIKLATVSLTDDRLRVAIYRNLAREFPLYLSGSHPSVIILVDRGRVTLVGYVNSNVDKQRMVTRIRSFNGVISVEDQLQMSTK